MSTTTKTLLRAAATVVFAIAATATTVSSAFAAETATTATAAAATTTVQPHALTRAEVQAQVIEARKNGTLLETEADFDVAQTRTHVAK
jgi:spore germination protein GerM